MTTYVDHDTWTVLQRTDLPHLTGTSPTILIKETSYVIRNILEDDQGRTVVTCDPA